MPQESTAQHVGYSRSTRGAARQVFCNLLGDKRLTKMADLVPRYLGSGYSGLRVSHRHVGFNEVLVTVYWYSHDLLLLQIYILRAYACEEVVEQNTKLLACQDRFYTHVLARAGWTAHFENGRVPT